MKRALLVLTLLSIGIGASGCQYFKERKAIEVYSHDVEKANKLMAQIAKLDDQKQLEKKLQEGIAPFNKYVNDRLIPLWEKYLKAQRDVRTETPRLRAIHKLLVDAHERNYTALKELQKDLTLNNLKTKLAEYLRVVNDARVMAQTYYTKLEAYYKDHHYTLRK
ncbi:MAG: hypothetical protein KC609_16915 [Myxococcales bacterium]|nr:hypothetical protein [Myxococcales bacterium]